MQMPIDVKAVMEAFTHTKQAAIDNIACSVWIDDTAPEELVAHVRAAFASAASNVRVTISYLGEDARVPVDSKDDAAVIVAGVSDLIGAQAAYIRSCGVPVMVVTTLPKLVGDMASVMGSPIPDGDLVYPVKVSGVLDTLKTKFDAEAAKNAVSGASSAKTGKGERGAAGSDDYAQEPLALDNAAKKLLDMRMGKWITTTCKGRKLAFAVAFPFVRRPLADDAVSATAMQNAAIGFVPLIPGADMPLMTINQVKMLLQIAAAYGQPLTTDRIKEIVALLGGAFACRHVARSITKVVPFAGWFVSGTVGYTATEAFGAAAIEYFEGGGDLKGIANVLEVAGNNGMKLAKNAAKSPVGQAVVSGIKDAAKQVINAR